VNDVEPSPKDSGVETMMAHRMGVESCLEEAKMAPGLVKAAKRELDKHEIGIAVRSSEFELKSLDFALHVAS
jgi:hypothetical protein